MNESKDNVIKRKKLNIFQRFSNRISKYFHKSKKSNSNLNDEGNLSKPCHGDISEKSNSHDDLRMRIKFQKKRKPFGKLLNFTIFRQLKQSKKCIQKRKDRCLSEGDIAHEDGLFYSGEPSPKTGTSRTYDTNTNKSSRCGSNLSNALNSSLRCSFKNELALKLRAKNQSRYNDSEYPKTPDSPTEVQTGTSHQFTEARTPQSMSSLSHSSNSLLSANVTNNYGTSDGESMSRSLIDSNDDSGIVVDLATPISKTTTAALLDFSAARQKIAASKSRRVRPKASIKDSDDKILPNDSDRFSPVRDKRDILEEISEEDFPISSTSTTLSKQHKSNKTSDNITINKVNMNSFSNRITASPKLLIQDNVPLTHKIVSIKLDSSVFDLPLSQPNEIANTKASDKETVQTAFNLRKSKFQLDCDKSMTDKTESTQKFYVKLRPTGNNNAVYSKPKSVVLSGKLMESLIAKEEECVPGPPKINRYSLVKTFSETKPGLTPALTLSTTTANKESNTAPNLTVGYDNIRSSRVLNIVKDFESIPCRDSH